MSVYDAEEQQRIDALKDWWAKWGNLVYATAMVLLLGIAGSQGWKYYQKKQVVEAETLFLSVQKVAQESAATKDWKKLSSAAMALADKYPGTFYATDAQLMAAKAAFDANALTEAKAHLQWVVDKGQATHQAIARARLATVLLDEKKYDDALKVLDGIKSDAFSSLAADVKGDIFVAQGRTDEARAAYQMAVDKADSRSPLKPISQSKLDAVGGTIEKPAEAKTDAKNDVKAAAGANK
ncbi:MAG: YfgM family protein [Burkholderiales bacterium]|jgi:predicted negative regulator of RcsB-dependent stress response|nr:tetratricopeptide repeat protein [Rhodocyclaceae bacterium]MCA3020976.1 tetratricopeptide repeat protein [Rhodocyclaceae bacterium]MCA3043132.1 tetratricopeptide repeat protein [Rhodocyclaceae bacterium]MCA3054298.1 tetratricopeptide repeat protein [Rhodocyclaceae bacterium]MCA3058147.1 tetratricopeptide repeat protein [Rhodocyclaceae bacterium]